MKLYIFLFFLIFFNISIASATTIDFPEQYQDYLVQTHNYNSYNLLLFPMYQVIDNGNNWTISRQGTTVDLPKQVTRNGITFNVNYQFLTDRIIPSIQINSFSQISNFVVKVNSTVWYLPFPWSASQVRSVTDDLIDMGVFKRTTSISVHDSNTTPNNYQVVPKVIGNNIRLYFNPQTYSGVVYPLTLTENTITVNNATTAGFTSANVTFDGVRWTDSGQIAINLRNDSQANMSGLVGYWSMDENTGTLVHNVNTESGLVNTTNQGTWYGNTTLNYSTGRIGNALVFDGVNDYIDVGSAASLKNQDITIIAWIKLPSSGTYSGIIGNAKTNGLNGYRTAKTNLHTFQGLIGDSTSYDIITGTTIIDNNIQHQIVFTVNNSYLRIYVDGNEDATPIPRTKIISWDNSLKIGNYGDLGAISYFNGSIDEVRIYNRALSAEEISVLYNTSMRTQGNLTILNQSAPKNITRVSVSYTGQDTVNNISIYTNKSGVTGLNLIVANATSGQYYNIPDSLQNYTMDFTLRLNSNGTLTPFLSSVTYDDTPRDNPFVAVGVAAMGIAISIAVYNMYRRRGRPTMMFIPVI